MYEKETITKVEFETLKEISQKLEPQSCKVSLNCKINIKNLFKENHDHVSVYLRCSPEIAMERVKKRGQTGDVKITLEDLILLHEKHEAYIKTLTGNVIVIDVKESANLDHIVDEMFKKLIPIIYMSLIVKDVEEA